MPGWDVTWVIDVKASTKIGHDVAGETELGAGGALHVFRVAQSNRQYRQDEERHKGQNLAAARSREFGAGGHQNRQYHGYADKKYFNEHRIYHLADPVSRGSTYRNRIAVLTGYF
jgi:hypothetical protein